MERRALEERNRRLAAQIHQPTRRQAWRDLCLAALAKAPFRGAPGDPQRLLVIVPDHLGDELLTTPALLWIKRRQPNAELHVLCGPANADLFRHYPAIDQVRTLEFPGFQRGAANASGNALALALNKARMLRRECYGGALILRPDHWWGALLSHLAGIPQRVGHTTRGVGPFLTCGIEPKREHALMRNLRLAAAWLDEPAPSTARLDFPVKQADQSHVAARLEALGMHSEQHYICIHPGAGASSKLWRADKMAALADALAAEFAPRIVFTGTPNEAGLIKEIAGQLQNTEPIVLGDLTIGEAAALYRMARLAVGPDSGIMHLAAAVGTATVALFGPADPAEFKPWGETSRHAVITSPMACMPCRVLDWRDDDPAWHPCVRDITVDQALQAARRLLRHRADST